MTEKPYTGKETQVPLLQAQEMSPEDAFDVRPANVPLSAVPMYDEELKAIIGYYHESQGMTRVYDLEGRLVLFEEKGLESPLIDPIDLVFVFGGAIRMLGRGLLGAMSRTGARASVRIGSGVAAYISARAAGQAVGHSLRVAFRVLSKKGLNFTATTAAHMANPSRFVPVHILQQAIVSGARSADPQGVAGVFQYTIKMWRMSGSSWKEYTLKVVLREADWTVLHFHYF